MVKVAIIGASGYTGLELLRLLAAHPEVEVTAVTSRKLDGQKVTDVFPALAGRLGGLDDQIFESPEAKNLTGRADFFFTAVPHRTAMEIVPSLLEGGGKVVDLSADFRFNEAAVYEEWYERHQVPELLSESVYGLPELYRDQIKTARLVGNPGCYPTSVILAMAPLLKKGLIEPDGIIADSKSGVSGAGRGLNMTTQFCEIDDGLMAYKVIGHRHTPEIEQELGLAFGRPLFISFTPHLVPLSRGILSTVYAALTQDSSDEELLAVLNEFYKDDVFVRVRKKGELPHTLDVRGTNFCDLSVFVDRRTGRVKMISAIDNLTRGASGQAICNMNLMLGLAEETGLIELGLRP
ncbi:MAG: N-acetyl-gamma-glutamyl-phosphate reductase [Deltaproteobacteria bacterium]|nr:N-acetyl-gamma-glutamyl-phosphate reductase [Deltaproteobacteria bacterium]MBW2052416.1 N-acetyl-gamma-glutamyl-phosphate reductase [Deltaproteobacteria bacterium]MBW2140139.1 N-acetyl-gamma-glutamyl-phosphate reductase [Deltaproteobacteria bacterium]MBW2323774.1 N-acetyl-gamma-glutamyl-phosphate reductase [Deltaproteobacteria bacterium]